MKRARGLALIEVLVAMAILSMMVFSVWSTFSSTLSGMERSEKIQLRYSMVRTALSRMTAELGMAYLSFNRPPDEAKHFTLFEGRNEFDADTLTFSSFTHLRLRKDAKESDQTVIQYFLGPDRDGEGVHLYRREARRLTGDLPEHLGEYVAAYILCEHVEFLDFKYWDVKEEAWRDDWSTVSNDAQPDRLPTRVMIRLGIRDGDEEIEIYSAQTQLFLQEKVDLGRG
ncbi:MAG: prepilin-type N-terminal cleavage/methylation domain-containing protein [Nannocystaceae bacterium]